MESTFSSWADIVTRRTLIVFIVSLICFIGLSLGMSMAEEFEDDSNIWTPDGNESLKAEAKSEILFPVEDKRNFVSLIWEANGDNILTVETLREMQSFEEQVLYQAFEYSDTKLNALNKLERKREGRIFRFEDVCEQQTVQKSDGTFVQKCLNSQNLLDFVWDVDSQRYLSGPNEAYGTNEKLLDQIQTGKGDSLRYAEDEFLNLSNMIAEPKPTLYFQKKKANDGLAANLPIGSNNIQQAKAIQYTYIMEHNRNPDIDEEAYLGFEEKLEELYDEWRKNVQTAEVHLQTINGFFEAIVEDINNDFGLIFGAIILVVIYLFNFLGTYSPMHCRCTVAFAGLICVALSYFGGFGFMYIVGGRTTGVHQLMPFLLIGIGADDMFVMCNAVDQTDYKKTAKERMHAAMGHAGPAITITSLTNALAFAFGATGSLKALSSFCLFASMCIIMLYLTVLTVFLSVLTWDTRRVEKKVNECCGLCCCEENSAACAFGKCASIKQMEYSWPDGVPKAALEKLEKEEMESDAAMKQSLKSSGTERCLGKYAAPIILHKWLRLVWIVIYVAWTSVAIYGLTEVTIHFETDFFVSKESPLYDYLQAQKNYFDTGMAPTEIYVESETIDWSDAAVQDQLTALNVALNDCTGCRKEWHIDDTVESWYKTYKSWLARGSCPLYPNLASSDDAIPSEFFYPCLFAMLQDETYGYLFGDIVLKDDNTIKGWRQSVRLAAMDRIAQDGPEYLDDVRALCDEYGVGDTYPYSGVMLDMEQYVVFLEETLFSIGLSICAVFIVVLFITGSFPVTVLVVFAVVLVDIYLIALIYYWDLTLNNIIVVQLVIGLGLSVDYSAHIAHTYLIVPAPTDYTKMEARMYKARVALSQMGSSVIHGGLSTFLAIIVTSGAKSYIFVVFFKVWLGIIVFGMSNGFILLPIIFSVIGPTPDPEHKKQEIVRRNSIRQSKLPAALQTNKVAEKNKEVDIEADDTHSAQNATQQPVLGQGFENQSAAASNPAFKVETDGMAEVELEEASKQAINSSQVKPGSKSKKEEQ